jgi:hypothetical protein
MIAKKAPAFRASSAARQTVWLITSLGAPEGHAIIAEPVEFEAKMFRP